ncbi:PH domain-containing protein [Candidatus Peregrinibacteria bacterium]|nr:PH domain-containing protein [Candidatus Peregrinibacteria bacterium]
MDHFPGQRENEIILEVIYKDAIVYAKLVLCYLIVAVLPIVLLFSLWYAIYGIEWNEKKIALTALASSFYLLLWLMYVCIAWISEAFDLFIITNERVIDVTQVSFFHRSMSTSPLDQIQDTTGEISGFLPTLFNYGNITIMTASGDATQIFIDHVDDPIQRARRILAWASAKKEGKPMIPWNKNQKEILNTTLA